MIVGMIGRVFRAVARVRPSDASRDLDRVGEELVGLEQRRAQRPTTSR